MDATPEPITPAPSPASRPAPRPPAPTAPAPAAPPPPTARPAPPERPRHGLRARSLAPVAALGETPELVAAHVAAYRREFPAPGPYARDLAEAIAAARLRAARADRMEAELLGGLAQAGPLGRSLHDDPDTRAALALIQRYRREAELSAKRARQELEALARARAAGLLPDEDEAAAAEADLDAALADISPIEPRIEKIEPVQRLAAAAAARQRRRAGRARAGPGAGAPDGRAAPLHRLPARVAHRLLPPPAPDGARRRPGRPRPLGPRGGRRGPRAPALAGRGRPRPRRDRARLRPPPSEPCRKLLRHDLPLGACADHEQRGEQGHGSNRAGAPPQAATRARPSGRQRLAWARMRPCSLGPAGAGGE